MGFEKKANYYKRCPYFYCYVRNEPMFHFVSQHSVAKLFGIEDSDLDLQACLGKEYVTSKKYTFISPDIYYA